MRTWSLAQKEAIGADNRDILVSAAAGSGKTSVMIERILRLLSGGAQLERMLVVTFTRAAAAEMRDRLTSALAGLAENDPHLREQYDRVGQAQISTLHQFCSRLLKRHFEPIGADPLTRTGDDVLTGALFEAALDETLDDFYLAPDAGAQALIDHYSDAEIAQLVEALYRFLMAQAAPFEWLSAHTGQEADGEALLRSPAMAVLRDAARLRLEGALAYAQQCAALCAAGGCPERYAECTENDIRALHMLLDEVDAGGLCPSLATVSAARLPAARKNETYDEGAKERYQALRDKMKGCIAEARPLLPASPGQLDRLAAAVRATQPELAALGKLCVSFHERYQRKKADRAVWDYNDLEHKALAALRDPGVAAEAARQFDYIFVDEYQDISRIQEAIIASLHAGNSLFMVGDVRQSIYRFRLADPTVFLDKYRRFSGGADSPMRRILLSENYRSSPNILRAVNEVFQLAMRKRVTELDYGEDARLNAGRAGAPDGDAVTLMVMAKAPGGPPPQEEGLDAPENGEDSAEDGQALTTAQTEAAAMAREIQRLRAGAYHYRDMVVLLRSAASKAQAVASVLKANGIPVYNDADAQYFELPEIRDTLNILRALRNPMDDTVLMAVLKSPVFGLTEHDLAALRTAAGVRPSFYQAVTGQAGQFPKAAAALDTLARWRFRAQHLPFDLFVRELVDESGVYVRAGALPGGEQRRANLLSLIARAAGDPRPYTLRGFLALVDEAKRRSRDEAARLSDADDVVRIMTIHKSKGLEFPVVFVAGLGQAFRFDGPAAPLRADNDLGLALRLVDSRRRVQGATLVARAIREKKARETRAEEARLLYVAMTRAREKLYLVGTPLRGNMDRARAIWSMPPGDYAVGSAGCMLDWVGCCLWAGLEGGHEVLHTGPLGAAWHIRPVDPGALRLPGGEAAGPAALPTVDVSPRVDALLREKPRPRQSAKTSVTALVRRAREDEEETPESKRREAPPPMPRPRLHAEEGFTAAQRGTLTHRALCALAPESVRGLKGDALRRQLAALFDGMAARGMVTPQERAALDAAMAARYLESPVGQRMLAARRVLREQPFTLKAEGGVLLQGVIDCCFEEDGAWTLVDYKTDRETAAILGRYRDQMRWYMRALRALTGQPVREAWLFALRTGEAFAVEETEEIRIQGE